MSEQETTRIRVGKKGWMEAPVIAAPPPEPAPPKAAKVKAKPRRKAAKK